MLVRNLKVGNIRKTNFKEIWLNHPILNLLRDRSRLRGHCKICEFRNVCGGCRARAFGYFKNIHAPDPGCIYNKKYWDEIQRDMRI